jgi:hypothetical protein
MEEHTYGLVTWFQWTEVKLINMANLLNKIIFSATWKRCKCTQLNYDGHTVNINSQGWFKSPTLIIKNTTVSRYETLIIEKKECRICDYFPNNPSVDWLCLSKSSRLLLQITKWRWQQFLALIFWKRKEHMLCKTVTWILTHLVERRITCCSTWE